VSRARSPPSARLAKVLGTKVDLSEVAAAVRKYPGEEIEQKLVDAKTTVALSRTIAEVVAVAHGRGETAASECSGDCARQ
jgi:hypothetical protein